MNITEAALDYVRSDTKMPKAIKELIIERLTMDTTLHEIPYCYKCSQDLAACTCKKGGGSSRKLPENKPVRRLPPTIVGPSIYCPGGKPPGFDDYYSSSAPVTAQYLSASEVAKLNEGY